MATTDLITRYNYDEFTAEKVMPWLNFEASPQLGQPAPDFTLTDSSGTETVTLSEFRGKKPVALVFGSFT